MAIMAEKKQKQKPATNLSTSDEPDLERRKQIKLPSFVCHFKHTSDHDPKKYKVDDSKIWNYVTYYFCDCPTHKEKLK